MLTRESASNQPWEGGNLLGRRDWGWEQRVEGGKEKSESGVQALMQRRAVPACPTFIVSSSRPYFAPELNTYSSCGQWPRLDCLTQRKHKSKTSCARYLGFLGLFECRTIWALDTRQYQAQGKCFEYSGLLHHNSKYGDARVQRHLGILPTCLIALNWANKNRRHL